MPETCDITGRNATLKDEETASISRSLASVMLGVKATVDEQTFYATTTLEQDDIQPTYRLETGMSFKI